MGPNTHLLAVFEDLDLVGLAGGLVVEVGGPLAGVRHVLVVEQPRHRVPLLGRADHGHHGVAAAGRTRLLTRGTILENEIETQ